MTQPIKYAKQNNSGRTSVMLALTWFTSVAVSLPIAVGINYTPRRAQTPTLCTFYNADFLIYSSMTSFYIPSIVIVFLYWRIFRVIHSRMRHRTATTAAPTLHRRLPNIYVVDNHANTAVDTSVAVKRAELEMVDSVAGCADDVAPHDSGPAAEGQAETAWAGGVAGETTVTVRTGCTDDCVLSLSSGQDSSSHRGATTDLTTTTRSAVGKRQRHLSEKMTSRQMNERGQEVSLVGTHGGCTSDSQSRHKNTSRRERKATKTLAIVLGTSTAYLLTDRHSTRSLQPHVTLD